MLYYCTKPVYVHIWSANHWKPGGSWTVAGIAFPFAGGSIPQENVSCLLQIYLKGGRYMILDFLGNLCSILGLAFAIWVYINPKKK